MISKERFTYDYSLSSFFVSRVLAEIPFQVFLSIIFSTVIYWGTGLNTEWYRFFVFILFIVFLNLTATGMGFLIACFSQSVQGATATGSPIIVILVLFGGYFINSDALPPGSDWVKYLSLVYWGFGGSFTC